MGKRYVTNDTPNTIYENGRMIPPGEGREIEFPDDASPVVQAPQVDEDADLREILAGNVSAVVDALQGLGDATLLRLQALESAAEKPRKGVLNALADCLLTIANTKLESDKLVGEGGGEGPSGGEGGNGNQPPAGQ